jgi:hypothetical protein
MDVIDVTSGMGRVLPSMCVVKATTAVCGCERTLAHEQVSRDSGTAGPAPVGVEIAPRPRPDVDGADFRGGTRRPPGLRPGATQTVGGAASACLVPPPDLLLLLEV